jgi:hypothetical protein
MPTIRFSNESDLLKAIQKDMGAVMDDLAEEIQSVVKENVKKFVYDPWEGKSRVYERRYEDGGFLGSWSYHKYFKNKIVGELVFSNPELMESPFLNLDNSSDIFLDLTDIIDRRNIMDRAIAEGTDWDFYVPDGMGYKESDNWWTRPRDYWSPTIAYLDNNLNDMASYCMAKHF